MDKIAQHLGLEEPERFHENNWLSSEASIENVRQCISLVANYKRGEVGPADFIAWGVTLPMIDRTHLVANGMKWEKEHK